MHDSRASHNLMPKSVMESLGLEITRPYKDLHSFDSSRVKCLGLIKDLCVNLAQILTKCLVMDLVVADVPPKYGMFLSRSWGAKLQGTMQMDMTYATIPVFNQSRRLYRESHMQYMVTSQDRRQNSPLYYVNTGLNSFILVNDETFSEQVTLNELMTNREEEVSTTKVSKLFAAFENISKPNKRLELKVRCPLLLNMYNQENNPQHK